MRIALAAVILGVSYLAALRIVRKASRRVVPPALSLPLALAVLICYETLLLRLLSAFRAVTPWGVAIGHVAVLALLGAMALRARRWDLVALTRDLFVSLARGGRSLARPLTPVAIALIPLFVLLFLSAAEYAPNNWDSMTYHLARVAHWIQNRSVAVYPTNINRQIVYPPGAEYLLLVLQTISGSDRLANFVQLGAYFAVVLAAEPLARLVGAPRRLAPWAAMLVAALPMGLLQATSTQNDLVAAALAIALVVPSFGLLHLRGRRHLTPLQAVEIGVAASAALLAKPTALVVAGPLLCAAASQAAWRLARAPDHIGPTWRAVAAALVLAAAPIVPAVADRSSVPPNSALFAPFVYPPFGEWSDRAANAVRGVFHHLPAPKALRQRIAPAAAPGCSPTGLCPNSISRPHEDLAGNPVQLAFLALAIGIGAARWRSLPARARFGLMALVTSWLLFHAAFRENAWMSRLQTPIFALTPLALGAFSCGPGRRQGRGSALVPVLAMIAVAHGYVTAGANEGRPPRIEAQRQGDGAVSYYRFRSELRPPQDEALEVARRRGCRRLGLYIGEDSYDYPLTWRAMQRGIEVRHVVGPGDWPCVVYSDRGPPPATPATTWSPTGSPLVYERVASPPAGEAR